MHKEEKYFMSFSNEFAPEIKYDLAMDLSRAPVLVDLSHSLGNFAWITTNNRWTKKCDLHNISWLEWNKTMEWNKIIFVFEKVSNGNRLMNNLKSTKEKKYRTP